MLARRTTLNHPIGATVDLPRLVPSFSSKGFPFFADKETGRKLSEVTDALEMTGPTISDSILVSAYDIHHDFLRQPERFYANKELVIIDSGGYELSLVFDSTEPEQGPYEPDDSYDNAAYLEVLRRLPSQYPIVVTNFDHESRGKPVEEQIIEAQALFNSFPQFLHDFIVKPSGRRRYIDIDDCIRHLDKMRRFHVLGVTEKELGSNLLERLVNIATLRSAMNRKSIETPIHVWGGLDPVVTPLYFCAGGEIFDGVSWLRYGYYADSSITRDAFTAIQLGVQTPWRRAEAMRMAANISYLETLTIRLRRFVDGGCCDFGVFGTHSDALCGAYQALCTKIPELRGGA
jgi:hypothetical protein